MSKLALEEKWSSVLAALQATRDAVAVLGPLRVQGVLGSADALKLWQLSLQAEDQRRAGGVYYTDYAEALSLAERVLARFDAFPARVLEPCCGGGNLLAALLDAGVSRFHTSARELAASIHAYELNPSGLWLAQWTIDDRFGADVTAQIQWHQADTLDALAPSSGVKTSFELIFGNPPYGNAIERSTRRSQSDRAQFASRYPLATRGAFDKCALFVEMAAQRCAPDGQLSYILPRSWLAQPASQHLRAVLAKEFDLLEIADLPAQTFFDASVATVALTLARRDASETRHSTTVLAPGHAPLELDATRLLLEGNWGAALHPFAKNLVHALETLPLLSSRVDFSAGASTEEAYAWVESLRDLGPPTEAPNAAAGATPPPNRSALLYALARERNTGADAAAQSAEKPLVIAGMIDPFELHWGTAPTRYLRQDYARPMIALDGLRETRRWRSAQSRALLPTLSLSLEAWPDLDGAVVGAVSTISAWVRREDAASEVSSKAEALGEQERCRGEATPTLHAQRQTLVLCALLNSAWMRLQYACLFGALALNGGNTQVSKNKLAALRAPHAWLSVLDAPPRSTAASPELKKHLHSAPPLPLSKRLPSLETLGQLQLRARTLHASFSADVLAATLMALLEDNAHAALHAGYLDQLLLALAPELPIAREEAVSTVTKVALH